MGRHPLKGGPKKGLSLKARGKALKQQQLRAREKNLKLKNAERIREKKMQVKSATLHVETYKLLEEENILLIGEGDFSFAVSMLETW